MLLSSIDVVIDSNAFFVAAAARPELVNTAVNLSQLATKRATDAITAPIPVANNAILKAFKAPVEVPTAAVYIACPAAASLLPTAETPSINADSFCKAFATS